MVLGGLKVLLIPDHCSICQRSWVLLNVASTVLANYRRLAFCPTNTATDEILTAHGTESGALQYRCLK